jgi:mannose/fructose/N-acetylgalactosamine-specific phosphotransferase system component IIC
MSKSIKIFFWMYVIGFSIIPLAILWALLANLNVEPNFGTGFLQAMIMLFVALPMMVIGLVGAIISLIHKKRKGEATSADGMVVKRLIIASISLAVIQLIGDASAWW